VPPAKVEDPGGGGFRLAMILVLFAYGGWNEMSYVAAEVRDPQRNLLRALLLGTAAVTTIYLLVNLSFLGALGFQGVRDADALASDVVAKVLGHGGRVAISVLICISCLGAINGSIFTGSRVYYALGTEHRLYAWLGRWNERAQAPLRSLAVQTVATLLLVGFFGARDSSFRRLVEFSAPYFWFFFTFVAISLFVLRVKDRDLPRSYRTPAFPIIAPIFLAAVLFMLYSSVTYAFGKFQAQKGTWHDNLESLWPVAIMLIGVAASFFDPPLQKTEGEVG
jgi:amino acid transporter